jgi:hypothetical protein
LIFVTQPLNAISPIDQKFFELIIPIATFLTGTLSGIMLAGGDKDAKKAALEAANKGWDKAPTPVSPTPNTSSTNSFGSQGIGAVGSVSPGFGAVPQMQGGFGQSFQQPMQPMMSSKGKPMPLQEPEPEL